MIPAHASIPSASGEITRDIWFYPAMTDEPHRLCLFLDAEHYIRDVKSLPVLQELLGNRGVPQISCLFVSHVSGAARHADYLCSERYADFIAWDVVTWARERLPLQDADHVICGLSLSGLQAAFLAFRHAQLFSRVLCQSGSFWWLAQNDIPLSPAQGKFWLSVGDEETSTGVSHPPTGMFQQVSQIAGVEAAAERFRALGGTVQYHLYAGGHAATPWREELGPALEWLLSDTTDQTAALSTACKGR